MKLHYLAMALVLAVAALPAEAQKKKQAVMNDSNSPLHLMQPNYQTPYGMLTEQGVKSKMDLVLHYLQKATPMAVVDKSTGKQVTDYEKIDANSQLERGTFRLGSYEWGVTYSAMLAAGEVTGDSTYTRYATDRFRFLASVFPHFKKVLTESGTVDPLIEMMITPRALDDCGAMCAAMMKASLKDKSLPVKDMIDNYFNFLMYKQFRLADGTLARNRPQKNTLWADDMFMGIPSMAIMGRYASDNNAKFQAEAVKQIQQFAGRMFVPEKGLFRHGWVEGMTDHPAFFWGRANGWAMLTLCEVLDALPENYPQRNAVLDLLRAHIRGVAALQNKDGFWHQLLDRNDSYLESSATAIYTYCIAHAINKGWIDASAYGPVAWLGWEAVSTAINAQGQVEKTCVGTGMAFDPAFYSYRPVSVYAAHGYGPVIWAGSEMINLIRKHHPRINDSAVQFYSEDIDTNAPIFSVPNPMRPNSVIAGSTRKENHPVVFLIGDSTVKCGNGDGSDGKWGWGSFFQNYFDTKRISIENHALGGRSSRTFYTEGLWDKVIPSVKKGDYVIMDFGHNDGGPYNTGRARASLPGIGEESQKFVMERDGSTEDVFTFGHYLRLYARQAKANGATVIITSHTPRNSWTGDKMDRCTDTYAKWSREVANSEGVYYIDLNDLTAKKFEAMGKEKTASYYGDGTHNNQAGAILNAESVIEGIRALKDCSLNTYLK